jgi:hypothetical protein
VFFLDSSSLRIGFYPILNSYKISLWFHRGTPFFPLEHFSYSIGNDIC